MQFGRRVVVRRAGLQRVSGLVGFAAVQLELGITVREVAEATEFAFSGVEMATPFGFVVVLEIDIGKVEGRLVVEVEDGGRGEGEAVGKTEGRRVLEVCLGRGESLLANIHHRSRTAWEGVAV